MGSNIEILQNGGPSSCPSRREMGLPLLPHAKSNRCYMDEDDDDDDDDDGVTLAGQQQHAGISVW